MDDTLVPFPYQIEVGKEIEEWNGRALVALDMGLGKTGISLWWLRAHPEALPALVVAPASVKYNWVHESIKFIGIRPSVCEGQTCPPTDVPFDHHSKITIINYDILKHWIPYLKRLKFKTIIFDEGQNLRNPRAGKTKAARELSKRVPHILVLSGTPLMNRTKELWSILNILHPKDFPSFWLYAQEYCAPKWTPWGWNCDGSSNLPKLHKSLIENYGMIRRRKLDVLKDLPDKIRRIIPCEISDPEQYIEASTDFTSWIKKHHAHKFRSVTKAESVQRVGHLLRLIAKLKMRSVCEWANRFLEETDEKLILFAIHRKAIEVLKKRVQAKAVVIDGSVPAKKRQIYVKQFQEDPHTRLFIGNIHAAGVGITLTAASEVGILEFPWRPADVLQAEARPDRIGQKNTVFINFLVARNTVEEDLCKILQKKQKILSAVLDGGPSVGDLNIYDELIETLSKGFK